MKMDKVKALHELLWQAGRNRVSMTGYLTAFKALRVLEIPEADQKDALAVLGYVRYDTGEPHQWLATRLAARGLPK